eukprot:38993_1
MNQFIQRVANYLANEVFIKGLAESKTFQRFAVHTDRHVQKYKQEGLEHVNAQMDELHKHATQAAYSASTRSASTSAGGGNHNILKPPVRPPEGVAGFFSALGRVIRRDLGIDK